ncbi:MAG: hypothetical protein ABIH72_02520 [archaeon]
MKEGLFRILGVVFLALGVIIVFAGVFLLFNSFSALTGFTISGEMNETATNFTGVFFLLIGLVIILSWGSYLISEKS